MSIYKGTQLIAANGAPGRNGTNGANGRDGANGQGIQIVNSFNEQHNNINFDGTIEITNTATGTWNTVGGYQSSVANGQGSVAYGYRAYTRGQGCVVLGNSVRNDGGSQGTVILGNRIDVSRTDNGSIIAGMNIESDDDMGQGAVVLGYGHTFLPEHDGSFVLGMGATDNGSSLLTTDMKGRSNGSWVVETVTGNATTGLGNGNPLRCMNVNGDIGISGDLAFYAYNKNNRNQKIGQFTLTEIVNALIDAGILTLPT